MHLGATLRNAEARGGAMRLAFDQPGRKNRSIEVDHIIAATGYKVALSRLKFMDEGIQSSIRKVADTPILSREFESSIPGLYFAGAAAANNFGPLLRFAYGAKYVSRRLAARLSR